MKKRTDWRPLIGLWGTRTAINPDDIPVELPIDGIIEGGVDDLGLGGFDDGFDDFADFGEWGDFDFDDTFRGREKEFDPDDWMDWGDDRWDSHGLAGDPIGDLIGSALGPYAYGEDGGRISGPWLPQVGGGGGGSSYKPFDFGIGGYSTGGLTSPRDPLAGLLGVNTSGGGGSKYEGTTTIFGVTVKVTDEKEDDQKAVSVSIAVGSSGGKKPADQKPADGGSSGGTKTNPSTTPPSTDPPKTKGQKTPNPMDERPVRGGPFAFTRNPVLDSLISGGIRRPTSDPAGWGNEGGGASGVGRGRVDWDLLVGGGVTDPVPYGDASGGGPFSKMRIGRVRPKKPTSDPSGWGG